MARKKRKTTTRRRRRATYTPRRRRRNPTSSSLVKMRGFLAMPKVEPVLWCSAGYVATTIAPRFVPIPQTNKFVKIGVEAGTAALLGGVVGKTMGRKKGELVALGGFIKVGASLLAEGLQRVGVSGLGDDMSLVSDMDLAGGMGASYMLGDGSFADDLTPLGYGGDELFDEDALSGMGATYAMT